MSKSQSIKNAREVAFLQIADDTPLARRSKADAKKYNSIKKLTRELNKDAWNKANRLLKGSWYPFTDNRWECFAPRKFGTHGGFGSPLRLMYEFKKAVLSQNWSNVLKLADCILKTYHAFIQRTHIKVMLTVLLSHPEMNNTVLSDLCSFLWKIENKKIRAEFLRCFCSLPKTIPSEALHEAVSSASDGCIFKKTKHGEKVILEAQYTAHIGKCEDNDMYVE